MTRKEAIEILKRNKPTSDPRRCGTELCEAVDMAIEALQEKERILKQLEELRDEPLMYCSEDYWEGHYIAAKEAIAIVRGEEEWT